MISLLQPLERRIGPQARSLLLALVQVHRHRAALSEKHKHSYEFYAAALIEGELRALTGRQIGSRKLAEMVGVNYTLITRWRKDSRFKRTADWAAEYVKSCPKRTTARFRARLARRALLHDYSFAQHLASMRLVPVRDIPNAIREPRPWMFALTHEL
jgi:hypothetical protein